MSDCQIKRTHCESCGSTDPEDVSPFANEGYTLCCNELVRTPHDRCKNHHG